MNETLKDNGPQERAAILQDAQPAPDQSSRNSGGSLTRPTRAARPSPLLSLGNLSTSPRAATCERSKNALIDSTAHLNSQYGRRPKFSSSVKSLCDRGSNRLAPIRWQYRILRDHHGRFDVCSAYVPIQVIALARLQQFVRPKRRDECVGFTIFIIKFPAQNPSVCFAAFESTCKPIFEFGNF